MKNFVLLCLLAGLFWTGRTAAQERDGSFTIRFQPAAALLAATEVPFQITVTDPRQKPVEHAQVKLEIKDKDSMNVRDFRAIMTGPGVYVAKPVFSSPGEWSVYVEVRRDQELTARAIQFQVAE